MSGNIGTPVRTYTPPAAGDKNPAAGFGGPRRTDSFRGALRDSARPATADRTKSLLLHVCCGPCAVMPITRLLGAGYAVTAWFMNPNIHPLSEYLRRREAAEQCAERLGVPIVCADEAWNLTAWLRAVAGRDTPPARCAYCCESRLEAAFAAARALGFAWVSSSLLYSRHQPHEVIRAAGQRLAGQHKAPDFLYHDFREDWQEGIERSKALELYRQAYCGCIYSEAERYQQKLERLTTREKAPRRQDTQAPAPKDERV